jgi:serine/threonine protein kinase
MASLKPPFRAEDMEGLYNKVVKGTYQRLPGHYSVDINEFMGLMLKVNPKARYTAAELLSMPNIIEKIKTVVNLKESVGESNTNLLQTIKVPSNLHHLTDKLPRPNYEPLKLSNLSDFDGFGTLYINQGSAVFKAERRAVLFETKVLLRKQPIKVHITKPLWSIIAICLACQKNIDLLTTSCRRCQLKIKWSKID